MNWQQQLDAELYRHDRLPKPDTSAGPTAGLMRLEAARMLWTLAAEPGQLTLDDTAEADAS